MVLDVWVTQEQAGLKGGSLLRNILLLCKPDTQSSVWATPPELAGAWERDCKEWNHGLVGQNAEYNTIPLRPS